MGRVFDDGTVQVDVFVVAISHVTVLCKGSVGQGGRKYGTTRTRRSIGSSDGEEFAFAGGRYHKGLELNGSADNAAQRSCGGVSGRHVSGRPNAARIPMSPEHFLRQWMRPFLSSSLRLPMDGSRSAACTSSVATNYVSR
ncbi:hypothetical protein D3C76_950740 [compost metagenome]